MGIASLVHARQMLHHQAPFQPLLQYLQMLPLLLWLSSESSRLPATGPISVVPVWGHRWLAGNANQCAHQGEGTVKAQLCVLSTIGEVTLLPLNLFLLT